MNDSNPTSSTPTTPGKLIKCSDASKNKQLCEFLRLIEVDIASHPERLIKLDLCLVPRIKSSVGGIEVDINTPLSVDDE